MCSLREVKIRHTAEKSLDAQKVGRERTTDHGKGEREELVYCFSVAASAFNTLRLQSVAVSFGLEGRHTQGQLEMYPIASRFPEIILIHHLSFLKWKRAVRRADLAENDDRGGPFLLCYCLAIVFAGYKLL